MPKHYLVPLILRRGGPVMTFVSKEKLGSDDWSYWLGTYHDFVGRGMPAVTTDYKAVQKTRISKEFYDAAVAESKRQHKRYRPKQRDPREVQW